MRESPIRFDRSSADIQAALTYSLAACKLIKSLTNTVALNTLLPPCYHNEKGLPVWD